MGDVLDLDALQLRSRGRHRPDVVGVAGERRSQSRTVTPASPARCERRAGTCAISAHQLRERAGPHPAGGPATSR